MNYGTRKNKIAYRCPACGVATVGLLGGLGSISDLLRLKCECGESALDIKKQNDGKLHLSVPCVYCKDGHGYTLSADITAREGVTSLGCPLSGMDILFIGDGEELSERLDRSAGELSLLMQSFEAEELSDIQPQDMSEDECPPDPAIYDTINFILRDLEAEGAVKCPCGDGKFDLRFCDEGIQVYCERCGASHTFYARSMSMAEEYLTIDSITLS